MRNPQASVRIRPAEGRARRVCPVGRHCDQSGRRPLRAAAGVRDVVHAWRRTRSGRLEAVSGHAAVLLDLDRTLNFRSVISSSAHVVGLRDDLPPTRGTFTYVGVVGFWRRCSSTRRLLARTAAQFEPTAVRSPAAQPRTRVSEGLRVFRSTGGAATYSGIATRSMCSTTVSLFLIVPSRALYGR